MPAQLGTLVVPVLASAPAVGAEGALYFNSTSNTLFASDGAAWNAVGGSGGVTISDTPPGSPTAGMLWLNGTTLALAVYYDSQWVETGQGSTANITGGSGLTVVDVPNMWFYAL